MCMIYTINIFIAFFKWSQENTTVSISFEMDNILSHLRFFFFFLNLIMYKALFYIKF